MKIVLHLGAHKTASTYLQKCLAQSGGRLAASAIAYQGPRELRPYLTNWPARHARSEAERIADAMAWLFDTAEEKGLQRLILSEEQFLGTLRPLMQGGTLYETLGESLAPVVRAMQGRPFEIVMALRGYDEFFASAYCQVLRGWRFQRFGAGLREHFLDHPRGWADVVADIAALCPAETPIRLWRYEDFEAVEDDIFLALAGPAAPPTRRIKGRPLQRPAHRAVAALHDMATRGFIPDARTIKRVFEETPPGPVAPRFAPWTREERRHFESRYAQDLIALSAEPRCRWILPSEQAAA